VIKKVHLNTCPIFDGYGVMGNFKFSKISYKVFHDLWTLLQEVIS